MKNIFRARRSLKSVYTANAIVQLVIYFLIAFAVSEFRMRILLLPFKSPLIVLILILSLIGASALTSVSTPRSAARAAGAARVRVNRAASESARATPPATSPRHRRAPG